MYTWDALKENAKKSKDIVVNYRTMFESRISAGGTEKTSIAPKSSYDLEGHAKKCVEGYYVLVNKTTQQLYKVSTPCIDDHHFKRRRHEICWRIVTSNTLKLCWNLYIWQELEDLMFYGQWTNLHDQSQNGSKSVTNAWVDWFHIFITHVNTNNIVMWVISQNNADWDCLTSREILKIQNPLLEEHCAFLEVINLCSMSWMCKKQTSVSHSSTESEIISLDAGLRLDGLPALELWDLIVSVLGNMTQTQRQRGDLFIIDRSQRSPGKTNALNNIDCVHRNVQSSHQEAFVECVWGQRSSDQDRSLKEGVLQWDMFPGLTELRLIGCSIELIWTLKSKSSTSTPKTNLLTFSPKEISHVMSGIICCACSTLAISVLQCVLIQWRNDLNKIPEENESQQHRDQWWIFFAREPSHASSTTSVSPGKRSYGSQDPWSSIAEKEEAVGATWYRHRPIESFWLPLAWTIYGKASLQQATQSGMTTALGLLEWKTDIEDIRAIGRPDETAWRMARKVRPGFSHEETLHDGPRNPLWTRKYLVTDRDDPILILKKGHDLNNSSLETMKQNLNFQ